MQFKGTRSRGKKCAKIRKRSVWTWGKSESSKEEEARGQGFSSEIN